MKILENQENGGGLVRRKTCARVTERERFNVSSCLGQHYRGDFHYLQSSSWLQDSIYIMFNTLNLDALCPSKEDGRRISGSDLQGQLRGQSEGRPNTE